MAFNYMRILGDFYPDVIAETTLGGSFENYTDIIFISGFVSQADLEDAETDPPGTARPDDRSVLYIDQDSLDVDEFIKWEGTKFVSEPIVDKCIIPIPFGHTEAVKNKWIGLFSQENRPSNEVPFIAPFDLTLKTITFTNQGSGKETDVEIWITPVGLEPNTDKTLLYTAQIRDARSVVIAGLNLQINAADKIAIFLKKFGVFEPMGPIIILWCEAANPTSVNNVDNFATRF